MFSPDPRKHRPPAPPAAAGTITQAIAQPGHQKVLDNIASSIMWVLSWSCEIIHYFPRHTVNGITQSIIIEFENPGDYFKKASRLLYACWAPLNYVFKLK